MPFSGSVDEQFEQAIEAASNLTDDPGNDVKLALYALYKQATEGDVSGNKPGITDFVGRAKYESWKKLAGTTAEDAKQRYADTVAELI